MREAENEVLRTPEPSLLWFTTPGLFLLNNFACLNGFLFNNKPRHGKQVYNDGHMTRQVSPRGQRDEDLISEAFYLISAAY